MQATRAHLTRLIAILVAAACASCGDDDARGNDCRAAFEQFEACGGDVVGTWRVVDFCEGKPFVLSDPFAGQCVGYELDASLESYTGKVSFDGTQTMSENLVGTASVDFSFPSSCLTTGQSCTSLSQSTTSRNIPCTERQNRCECVGTLTNAFDNSPDAYTIMNDAIVVTGQAPSPYCVQGDTLRIKLDDAQQGGIVTLRKE